MSVNFGLDDVNGTIIGDIDHKAKLIAPNGKLSATGWLNGLSDKEWGQSNLDRLKEECPIDWRFNELYGEGQWEVRIYDC